MRGAQKRKAHLLSYTRRGWHRASKLWRRRRRRVLRWVTNP
jgi:hypothetical protein